MVNRYRWKTNAITAAGAAIIGIAVVLILIPSLRLLTSCLFEIEPLWRTIALLAAGIVLLPVGLRLINEAEDRREFRKDLQQFDINTGEIDE